MKNGTYTNKCEVIEISEIIGDADLRCALLGDKDSFGKCGPTCPGGNYMIISLVNFKIELYWYMFKECGDESGKCYVGGTLNCSETNDGKSLKCNCKSNGNILW